MLRQEIADAVTSCAPERATPAQLLALWRGHWSIENRLHSIRDVTFDEDRATARSGHAPQVMAAFRNTAIGLRRLGAANIASACRRCATRPALALAAVGLTDLEETLQRSYAVLTRTTIKDRMESIPRAAKNAR